MHIGISVQRTELSVNAQHLVIHVDDDLFNELEEIFTVHNAEEVFDDDRVHWQTEQKYIEPEIDAVHFINNNKKYIIHFICDLRCDTLRCLCDAIKLYASYFIELHISLSSQIEDDQMMTNMNTNPLQISQNVDNLKNVLLSEGLSLHSFHLYINIISNVYDAVYSQLLHVLNDKLFDRFMDIEHGQKQSLCFIFALSEESIKALNQNKSNHHHNYWNDIQHFLSHSTRMHHTELVVKTKSSLYTDSESHGILFNELLRYINDNKQSNSIYSLKLTCWGFLNNCSVETQKIFAKYLKDIIVNKGIQRLWLRYAGINEVILSDVFDAVRENTMLKDLKIQRMLLNDDGKCLSEFGRVISHHVAIESVEIGWNMASIPDMKYYDDLLEGIANNGCNLKRIEIYADNECTLDVLRAVLKRNVILQHIKIHLIDWNMSNNDCNSQTSVNKCAKRMDAMIENQIYLQKQMNAVKKCLNKYCEFPNDLVMDVLDFMYSKECSLNVEIVMNFDTEIYHSIMSILTKKKSQLKKEFDVSLANRPLKFQVSRPWPS